MMKKNLMKIFFSLIFFLTQKFQNSSRSFTQEEIGLLLCSCQRRQKPNQTSCPKEDFWPLFPLVSHSKKFSLIGTQNYGLFIVVAQTRLDRIRARVCCNSNLFEFQFKPNFFSSLSDLNRDLPKNFGCGKHMGALPFYYTNQGPS